jgi:hypothetical protein
VASADGVLIAPPGSLVPGLGAQDGVTGRPGVSTVSLSATSTSTDALALSSQTKLDRCQNGVRWMMYWDGTSTTSTSMRFRYSSDGTTWNDPGTSSFFGFAGTATSYTPNGSFFIDLDDYAHVVYRDRSNSFIYYRRGTPNAGRTAWTWSAATLVSNLSTTIDYPDIVAHREGTGWKAHIVFSRPDGSAFDDRMLYCQVTITSGGSISAASVESRGGDYQVNAHKFPSIDFNHTGDGKTVAGGTPHLYVAWSVGATGAGKGIRFRKASYSGGVWTWGTEQEIDPDRWTAWVNTNWLSCRFDGTRVVIGAHLMQTDNYYDLVMYERDAADTATATSVFFEGSASSPGYGDLPYSGSMAIDTAQNVHFFGRLGYGANGTRTMMYRKFDRTTRQLSQVWFGGEVHPDTPTVSASRGTTLDFVYRDGNTSAYSLRYGKLVAPTMPSISSLGDVARWAPDSSQAPVVSVAHEFPTAYSNGRRLDRTSDGTLWLLVPRPTSEFTTYQATMYYSKDNGQTWKEDGSGYGNVPNGSGTSTSQAYEPEMSMFIDQDDHCHLVFRERTNGWLYYRRGLLTSAGTGWSWESVFLFQSSYTNNRFPDVVAYRSPDGAGWTVHVVWTGPSTTANSLQYRQLGISSVGLITLRPDGTGGYPFQSFGDASYSNSVYRYPSIDFHHTGDGKTPTATPHAFVAWSAGQAGAGHGIRFCKLTYSAGTWAWGTIREIDNTVYIDSSGTYFLNCFYDGTRVVIAGSLTEVGEAHLGIWDRDVADTTTTQQYKVAQGSSRHFYGSATYDSSGNVYVFSQNPWSGAATAGYYKWTRGVGAGSRVVIDAVVPDGSTRGVYISSRRGFWDNRVEYVYAAGPASGALRVTYGAVGFALPSAPAISSLERPFYARPAVSADVAAGDTAAPRTTMTAYSNQRKIDRCQDGTLVTIVYKRPDSTPGGLYYSKDNGVTWTLTGTDPVGSASYTSNGSLFIDLDDCIHLVYKKPNDGWIYYRRGTPDVGRTTWTWSADTQVYNGTDWDFPDIVAHREGTGWRAHIVISRGTQSASGLMYVRMDVTSGGVITVGDGPTAKDSGTQGGGTNAVACLDFNHTGDGKTVAGGTPHLYVAWSKGTLGSGNGIRFKKVTYSGGTWTWGTERQIDIHYAYVDSTDRSFLNCLFDGTRVVIAGYLWDGTNRELCVWDRDVADTTTTTHPQLTLDAVSERFWNGSVTYDASGNLYLWGVTQDSTRRLLFRKWTRSTTSFSEASVIDASVVTGWASAKRGYSNSRIEFIYTDGTAAPYTVKYGSVYLGSVPSAPVVSVPTTIQVGDPLATSWTHSDPDGDPQERARVRYRKQVP